MGSSAAQLPVDILLLIFQELGDLVFLWSTCRNVSRFWRDCVDERVRHGVVQNTLIDLHYSDIHFHPGPVNLCIHEPMVFDRFSDDGTRAIFQQRTYKQASGSRAKGSLRGWVPFIERYCKETLKPKPTVLNKSKSSDAAPLWEREHPRWRNHLFGETKDTYLTFLRDMTSIGRGDRPPYYIKVLDTVNDTELVDLVIDCKQREISFNWRNTYSMFFREDAFAHVLESSSKKRVYDEDLTAVALRYFVDDHKRHDNKYRARQKRLAPWVAKNKHRMSAEARLATANIVDRENLWVQRYLHRDNLAELPEGYEETNEIVPAKLADDHPDLLLWPWVNPDTFFTPKKRVLCGGDNCVIL